MRKILQVHNYYDISGGEDSVVEAESGLLSVKNTIIPIYESNESIKGVRQKIKTAVGIAKSNGSKERLSKAIKKNKVDVVHVHNFFPKLTASVFDATYEANVASVFTLHNYRTICPTALLMHNGKPCERSIKEKAYWAVPHRVYRNSFFGTTALAYMIEYHKRKKTWKTKVDRFICLTEFSKAKFIQAGFPASKIVVKPNFTKDPGGETMIPRKRRAVFVGRLSEEKGIEVLINAWNKINFPLDIIGEGEVIGVDNNAVCLLGRKHKEFVIDAVKSVEFIIVPSICYEGFPMAIVEAFACGTPVLCSRLGSMEEIVEDGVTGLHFEAGNSQDLQEKAQWLIDNPEQTREMGRNARNEYLAKYTPEKNYEMLMDIYQQAIDEAKKH